MAFPLPPGMPFGALVGEVMPLAFNQHSDWEQINWDKVVWMLDNGPFTPDFDKSLEENGIGHKSVVRFKTPGLNGIDGSGS